ncbi:MAG: TIGR00730 family Rossman fold protein [Magnetococcales bacterium]|nr:TIGR00730 family Rossman fold protein [Magnetococcales bacterium]
MNNLRSKTLCIFCGSFSGAEEEYTTQAKALGERLGQDGVKLIFGGGTTGLMKEVADGFLAHAPKEWLTGVIPKTLMDREGIHEGIGECHITENLLDRKMLMIERADAVIALPGGLGTFNEIFEVALLNQLKLTQIPISLFNILGYFDPLDALFRATMERKFCDLQDLDGLIMDADPDRLLDKLNAMFDPQTGSS